MMKKLLSFITCTVISLGAVFSLTACGNQGTKGTVDGKYNITVAVQKEEGELELMEIYKEAYEKKHPEVNIVIKDFKGALFQAYMSKYAMSE